MDILRFVSFAVNLIVVLICARTIICKPQYKWLLLSGIFWCGHSIVFYLAVMLLNLNPVFLNEWSTAIRIQGAILLGYGAIELCRK